MTGCENMLAHIREHKHMHTGSTQYTMTLSEHTLLLLLIPLIGSVASPYI